MKRIKMNLQLFAEANGDTLPVTPPTTPPAETPETNPQSPPMSYTAEDIAKEKEKWLAETQKKHQAEIAQAKKDAAAEAERLAKLSADDRKAEAETALLNELEELRAERAKAVLMGEASIELKTNALPSTFAKIVYADTTEKIKENVLSLKNAFDVAVEETVKKRLAGTTPSTGESGSSGSAMKSQVEKIFGL